MTEVEMVGWHHRLNGHEFEQTPGDSGAWQTTVHGVSKEPDTTEPLSTRHVPFNGTQGFPVLHILNSTSRLSF